MVSNGQMKLRWRVVLPFGHLAVDCLLLVLWLWHAPSLFRPKADASPWRIESVFLFQESESIPFDPKFIVPPAEFLLLASGTLPAALVSGAVRPEAHIVTSAKLWDPIWFLIHETESGPRCQDHFLIAIRLETAGLICSPISSNLARVSPGAFDP